MFGIGMPELIIILVVALIVVGPKKLPDLAKSLGKGMKQFRAATDELKGSLSEHEAYQDFQDIKSTVKDTVSSMKPDNLLDAGEILEPKKPEPKDEGRKELMADIAAEQGLAEDKKEEGQAGEAQTEAGADAEPAAAVDDAPQAGAGDSPPPPPPPTKPASDA